MEKTEIALRDIFSSDNEVYTLQCPDFMTEETILKFFRGFHTGKASQYKEEKNENLNVDVLSMDKKFVTIAAPTQSQNSSLFKVPLKGHILIQKAFGSHLHNKEGLLAAVENSSITFPSDIKIKRHPLLGVNWKSHMKAANDAISQITQNLNRCSARKHADQKFEKYSLTKVKKRVINDKDEDKLLPSKKKKSNNKKF